MKDTLTALLLQHKNVILYIFFGGLTTLVNIIIYYFAVSYIKLSMFSSVIIAWILAVLFAYLTNRQWIFKSSKNTQMGIIKECLTFYWYRILTGLLDIVIMWLGVELLALNDIFVKTASNIIVIVLNYLASKFMIFK